MRFGLNFVGVNPSCFPFVLSRIMRLAPTTRRSLAMISAAAGLIAWNPVAAQEGGASGNAGDGSAHPAVVQEKLQQWVRTRQRISEERADWETEKRTLADLEAIRRKELEQLDAFIEAAGSRLSDAESQRNDLLSEQDRLRTGRARLEREIGELEASLEAQLASFPPPLLESVEEAAARIREGDPDAPLQNRWRDVLAILSEATRFQNRLTLHREIREIEGQRVEVDVLYAGLAQAWYAGRSNQVAGTGRREPEGWVWTARPELGGRIRQAIAIHEKEAAPGFITLPFNAAL